MHRDNLEKKDSFKAEGCSTPNPPDLLCAPRASSAKVPKTLVQLGPCSQRRRKYNGRRACLPAFVGLCGSAEVTIEPIPTCLAFPTVASLQFFFRGKWKTMGVSLWFRGKSFA